MQTVSSRPALVSIIHEHRFLVEKCGRRHRLDGHFPLIAEVLSSYDHTYTFNTMATSDLPFGKGKRWATGGAGAMLLGGWQVNSMVTMDTGGPFSVTSAGGSLNAPGNGQTADQIVAVYGTRDLWFDTTAYAPVTTPASARALGSVARAGAGECGPERLPQGGWSPVCRIRAGKG